MNDSSLRSLDWGTPFPDPERSATIEIYQMPVQLSPDKLAGQTVAQAVRYVLRQHLQDPSNEEDIRNSFRNHWNPETRELVIDSL